MGRFSFSAFFSFWLLALCLFFPSALSYAQNNVDWTAPGDKIEESEGRGLVIRSNPGAAKVYIDGIDRGYTPLSMENIRPGRYGVRLQKDGYSDRVFRVSVRAGSVTNVSIELQEAIGRVLLKIRPAEGSPGPEKLPLDPQISVDGRSFSQPAMELQVGFRNILVRSFGWEDASVTVYVEEGSYNEPELIMKPARFRVSGASLSRPRFNPANAGSLGATSVNFSVTGPGKGSLAVFDPAGRIVFERPLNSFETWSQSTAWNGRDGQGEIQDDGIYTLVIKAASIPWDDSEALEETVELKTEIDSTSIIQPLGISSGKSGLLFAPLPTLLPPGSFQIEGSLLAGSPPASPAAQNGAADSADAVWPNPWTSLPFAVAFRFSPLDRLEVSAALNVDPYFAGDTRTGFGGGVKWVFLNSHEGSLPLGAAAGITGAWTGNTGLTPFGMASGIEAYAPFKLDFFRVFSFVLSPAVLWTGDEGFPWDPAPRLLVSAGVMAQMTYFSAGLSVRQEFNFTGTGPWPPSIMAGGELKFYPPPSSFVFSVMGGIWKRDGHFGGFGGLGIGMIH